MSETSPAAVVILAAGEGKRMKSRTPKVLHTLCGRTLLGHALAAADELDPARLVVVVGHGREQVAAEVAAVTPQALIVRQDQQLGTGHAVRMVTEAIGAIPGTVVVSYGDMPLLRGQTLRELVDQHHRAGNAVTVLTARGDAPATGGSSGTPTARSCASSRSATPRPRSGPSTSTTPAATPSTGPCWRTRSSG